jgi:hypothetical protein
MFHIIPYLISYFVREGIIQLKQKYGKNKGDKGNYVKSNKKRY